MALSASRGLAEIRDAAAPEFSVFSLFFFAQLEPGDFESYFCNSRENRIQIRCIYSLTPIVETNFRTMGTSGKILYM